MALSADKLRSFAGTPLGVPMPVEGAARIYHGSLIVASASGHAQPATDTAGRRVLGVATTAVNNTDGADGDETVVGHRGHLEWFASTGLTQAQVGANVFAVDDETVSDGAATTNSVAVGTLLALDGSSVLVHVGVFSSVDA